MHAYLEEECRVLPSTFDAEPEVLLRRERRVSCERGDGVWAPSTEIRVIVSALSVGMNSEGNVKEFCQDIEGEVGTTAERNRRVEG